MTVEHRMADRLQELLQQRALIKEHLAWLEGEISAASGRPAETSGSFPALSRPMPAAGSAGTGSIFTPAPHPVPVSFPKREGDAGRMRDEVETMIARLAAEENAAPIPTKKGCWIFFWGTLVVLAVGAWAVIHYFYRE